MIIIAEIQFLDGVVRTCRGKVVNGLCVPWESIEDLKAHVAYIALKRGDEFKLVSYRVE